jgi:glycosyltransferase involved in cell wall biosynthesis
MRVLQLSTHSTLIPTHGGKLRSHHIGRVLEQQGFDVRRIALCYRVPEDLEDPREPIVDVKHMPFWASREFESHGRCGILLSDYFATVGALRTPGVLAQFDRLVRAAAPEIVLLEHPWTWPLLARLPEVRSGAVRLIYSSQNVEIALKRKVLQEEGLTPRPGVLEAVEAIERELVANAVGVSACTQADANAFAAWGARRVVLAANGGVRRNRDHLFNILPEPLAPSHAFALAVGSGHPPNVSGFLNLIAPSLSLLRPNQRVVFAGSASGGIVQALHEKGFGHLPDGRLIAFGLVDEFCLDGLIANAHVLLLPIQYGSGSNVKTAEALLSGRPMIATDVAMRGFGAFRNMPGLTVANDAESFGRYLRAALDRPYQRATPDHPALAALLWEATIAPLVALLRELESDRTVDRSAAARLDDVHQVKQPA